jgi:hypothetical protein
MAMVTILSEKGEVAPALLNRAICLEIRDEQVEKLLHI